MGFLRFENDERYQNAIDGIYHSQFEADARLSQELNGAAKRKMYEDVRYNANLLFISLELKDEKLFEEYARWLYQLLVPLMNYMSGERVRDQLAAHYALLGKGMEPFTKKEELPMLKRLIDGAIRATFEEWKAGPPSEPTGPKRYDEETKEFLNCLMKADTKRARYLLLEYIRQGIGLADVYVDIAGESMREVGELWHRHLISVDQEHYCTSVTQTALSQLYPIIFNQERRDKTMIAACVGSELHEMGARMVADLFEYSGWDSIYLGAAVPAEAVLSAVELHRPDLIALSVTMPEHLVICRETVERIREKHPKLPIAVGGRAFESTNEIWKNWRVDVYTQDARDLVKWAEDTLEKRRC